MAKIDGLIAEVEEVRGTVASAVALIEGLKKQIIEAGTDQAALDEVVAQLDAQQQALAAAVALHSDPVDTTDPSDPVDLETIEDDSEIADEDTQD